MISINQLKKIFSESRKTLNVVIILATLAAAVYYFYTHRSLVTDLKHISPFTAIEVFTLYILMLAVLVVIYEATMRLVNVRVRLRDNGLINAYSLFMNFFIPGQTGPLFRAYYMKKNYQLKYLDYTLATIIYYLVYALLSLIFIMAGSQPYYLTLPVVAAVIILSIVGLKIYLKRKNKTRLHLSVRNVFFLIVATLGQVVLQTFIYFIEVHSVKHDIHFSQIITYTGTANLTLFIALTPGAIGIREGFLILTERLNHVSSSTIVLANVIDRSVYIIFLLVVGLAIAAFKIKDRLGATTFSKDDAV